MKEAAGSLGSGLASLHIKGVPPGELLALSRN